MNKAPKSMRRRQEQEVAVKKNSLVWQAAKLLFATGVATTVAYFMFHHKPLTNHLTPTPKIPIKKELKVEGNSLGIQESRNQKGIQEEYQLSKEELARLKERVAAPPQTIAKPEKGLNDDFITADDQPSVYKKRMEELQKRWESQVPDAMITAAGKGILKDFDIVELKTGIPDGVLPTISMFESNMTDNPLAEGDILQVKGGTFLDAFCNYKDNFIKTYKDVKSKRSIVDTVEKLAPYVSRVYNKDSKKMDFVFNERGYLKRYKQLPKVDGKRYGSLEETVKSLANLNFIQIAFTASHLFDLRMQLVKKLQNDSGGLKYLAEIGPASYRLLHIYGVGGVSDIVKHRDGLIAHALPSGHLRDQIHVRSARSSTRHVVGSVQDSFEGVRKAIMGYQNIAHDVAITKPARERPDSEGAKMAVAVLKGRLRTADKKL